MTSQQLRWSARLQQEHLVTHPEGMKVTKFVTVVVEKKDELGDEIGVECYMVSDQCQVLERDNIFGDTDDPKKLTIRTNLKEDECMPAVLREGAPVKEFEPDFFIVSLANGQPNDANQKFNYLKRFDYPVMNRFGKMPTNGDFKNFLNSSRG